MNIEQLIYDAARANGMPDILSKLIVAQAKHETGNFTSPVYRNNNNLFGYKFRGQKLAIQGSQAPKGEWQKKEIPEYYAKYLKLEDSVKELAEWIKRRQKEKIFPVNLSDIKTPQQYALLLKKSGYYGDTLANYTRNLNAYYKKLAIGGTLLILPFLAGLALYWVVTKT